MNIKKLVVEFDSRVRCSPGGCDDCYISVEPHRARR